MTLEYEISEAEDRAESVLRSTTIDEKGSVRQK